MTDSAVRRARERALGNQPENGLRNSGSVAPSTQAQRFVEITSRGRQYRVPDPQWYSLAADQQQRFLDAIDEEGNNAEGQTVFDRTALAVMDQQSAQAQRITTLESQLGTALALIERLQKRLDQVNFKVEVTKSDALAEQQVKLAQMTVNLQAVGAAQEADHLRRMRECEQQEADHEQRLETTERLVKDQEGRLKSSGALFQERTAGVEQKLSSVEGRLAKAEVEQADLDTAITANRSTLRAVTGTDFASEIDLAVKQSFDSRLEPAMSELVARKYVTTAPTTGTDGYEPKIEEQPFLTEQEGDNATERAVNRALRKKRGG